MSRTLLNGSLAEKARIANMLICELLGALPDVVLEPQREVLHKVSTALVEIHDALRSMDYKDESKGAR